MVLLRSFNHDIAEINSRKYWSYAIVELTTLVDLQALNHELFSDRPKSWTVLWSR
jgi:hypothetical protein